MRNDDVGTVSRWPRALASMIAVGLVASGLLALPVGIGGGLLLREVVKKDAGQPHRHTGEEVFCKHDLGAGGIVIGAAGTLHLLAGGLYLLSKRFPSLIAAAPCFLHTIFWGFLTIRQGGASLLSGLALFGSLALLSFAAGWVFLHPAVRQRNTMAALRM